MNEVQFRRLFLYLSLVWFAVLSLPLIPFLNLGLLNDNKPDLTSSEEESTIIKDISELNLEYSDRNYPDIENAIIDQINQYRRKNSINLLERDSILSVVARSYCFDVKENDKTSQNDLNLYSRKALLERKTIYFIVNKNINYKVDDINELQVSELADIILNSDSNYFDILNTDFNHIGLGITIFNGNVFMSVILAEPIIKLDNPLDYIVYKGDKIPISGYFLKDIEEKSMVIEMFLLYQNKPWYSIIRKSYEQTIYNISFQRSGNNQFKCELEFPRKGLYTFSIKVNNKIIYGEPIRVK